MAALSFVNEGESGTCLISFSEVGDRLFKIQRPGAGTDSGDGDCARADEPAAGSEEDWAGADPIGGCQWTCLEVPLSPERPAAEDRAPVRPGAAGDLTPVRPGCGDA